MGLGPKRGFPQFAGRQRLVLIADCLKQLGFELRPILLEIEQGIGAARCQDDLAAAIGQHNDVPRGSFGN